MFSEDNLDELFRRSMYAECDKPKRYIDTQLAEVRKQLSSVQDVLRREFFSPEGQRGGEGDETPASTGGAEGSTKAPDVDAFDLDDILLPSLIAELDVFHTVVSKVVGKAVALQEVLEQHAAASDAERESIVLPSTDFLAAFLKLMRTTLQTSCQEVLQLFPEAHAVCAKLLLALFHLGTCAGSCVCDAGGLLEAAEPLLNPAVFQSELVASLVPKWLLQPAETSNGGDAVPTSSSDIANSQLSLPSIDASAIYYIFWTREESRRRVLTLCASVQNGIDGSGGSQELECSSSSNNGFFHQFNVVDLLHVVLLRSHVRDVSENASKVAGGAVTGENKAIDVADLNSKVDSVIKTLRDVFVPQLMSSLVAAYQNPSNKKYGKNELLRIIMQSVYAPMIERLRSFHDADGTPTSTLRQLLESGADSSLVGLLDTTLSTMLYRVLLWIENEAKVNLTGSNSTSKTAAAAGKVQSMKKKSQSSGLKEKTLTRNGAEIGEMSMEFVESFVNRRTLTLRSAGSFSPSGQPVYIISNPASPKDSSGVVYLYLERGHLFTKRRRLDQYRELEMLENLVPK